jgi:[ribosomal protein S18]-alanine N-acetyltransferase
VGQPERSGTEMTAVSVAIEPMTLDHVDAVLVIERAAAPHPWTRGILLDELNHTDTRTYKVAVNDGVVVGFGGVLYQVGEAHITNVAVAPEWRRNGIARALMVSLMNAAISGGATVATLEVRTSNLGAQRLYHQFGFIPAGVRPGYYADGEGAVIMWTEDITTADYADRLSRSELGDVSR